MIHLVRQFSWLLSCAGSNPDLRRQPERRRHLRQLRLRPRRGKHIRAPHQQPVKGKRWIDG